MQQVPLVVDGLGCLQQSDQLGSNQVYLLVHCNTCGSTQPHGLVLRFALDVFVGALFFRAAPS